MRTQILVLAAITGLTAAWGQDYRPLNDSVDNFKGMANEVRKNNPVLSVSSGEGIAEAIKSLKLGRKKTAGVPVQLSLPKEQQEELERRLKAKEKAAARSAHTPRQVAAAPKPVYKPGLEPVPPVVMLAIFSSPLRQRDRTVSETAFGEVRAGQSRESLLAALGKPVATRGVAGLEGASRETLTYRLDGNRSAHVVLEGGKVVEIQRN